MIKSKNEQDIRVDFVNSKINYKIIYCIILLILVLPVRFAIASPLSNSGNLEVEIDNFHSDNGTVRVHIYNSELKEYFPKKTENCFRCLVGKIKDNKALIVFKNLPFDTYCLSVHHDENDNVKMDQTLLGFPSEGWGISNNVKLFLRLPEFEECSFSIEKVYTRIVVNMRY